MHPLVVQEPVHSVFQLTLVVWIVVEAVMRYRSRLAGQARLEWTFVVFFAAIAGGFRAAAAISQHHAGLLPGGGVWPAAGGLALMWAGITLRIWAVLSLGHFFKFMVAVQVDHHVVQRGPYRLVRHPGYTAVLMILAGAGLTLGYWGSLAAAVGDALVAALVRIHVEEPELLTALGEEYASYRDRTWRLIPGIY